MTWILSQLNILGVKGILNSYGDFKLSPKKGKPKSLAVFGRNGHGKSGYADAVEYLFSLDGEVKHLGQGGEDSERGGKHAIPHVLAHEKGIKPKVSAEFINIKNGEKIQITRPVIVGRKDSRPKELESIIAKSPAHRILRQHDLRHFVVDMAPGEKFTEFTRWIGLERITNLLKHLTTVERTMKETDVDREIAERLKSIEQHTSGAIHSYDLLAIIKWCENEIAKYIEKPFIINNINEIDNALIILREKRELLVIQSQANQINLTCANLEKIAKELLKEQGDIQSLKEALINALETEQNKKEIQEKANQSIFQEVWENIQKVFEKQITDICPICQTPWINTVAGSQDNVIVTINKSLESFSQLKEITQKHSNNLQILKNILQKIIMILNDIDSHAKSISISEISKKAIQLKNDFSNQHQNLNKLQENQEKFINILSECSEFAEKSIPNSLVNMKKEIVVSATSNIDIFISHLQGLQESILRLEDLQQLQKSIRNIEKQFNKIADRIREETNKVAQNAIKILNSDVKNIYKKIHPGEAIPDIFIKLNTDEKMFTIRINFHSNERIVPPGGYLSEAQLNTIGLALFLSSVRLFNRDFPFVFLDDIVSSYDADSRARIVNVLAEDMQDFQIFLTTHDERFYTHLKGRLKSENWTFERIARYEFDKGPRRESDNLRKEQIDELIKQGDERIAGNAVRQYMEDWFDTICEKFYVYTLHKKGSREFKRTLSDYWNPLVSKLRESKGEVPKIILGSNAYKQFESSLFEIINYYSHNQTNPYELGSIGDIKYIWEAFLDFINLFCCNNCNKVLNYDFNEKKYYCTCGGVIIKVLDKEEGQDEQ